MATLYKAESISNLEKSPPVLSELGKFGGRVRCAVASFTVDGGGSPSITNTDKYHFVKLPSHATVVSMRMINDDMGGTVDAEIGLWEPVAGTSGTDLSTVEVDKDCFTSGMNIGQTAESVKWECIGDRSDQISLIGEPLWKWAGETSDPIVDYWITLSFGTTVSGVPTDERTFALIVLYVID